MITKNFRSELPIVEWIEEYTAIDNGKELRGSYNSITMELETKYFEEIYNTKYDINNPNNSNPDMQRARIFSESNITPVYENGYLLKMATNSDKGNDLCYVIKKDGSVATKKIEKIRFLNSDKILEDSKDLNETLDRFYDLEMMVGQLMIEDTFEDFLKLITLVLQNKLIKENIVTIAQGFKNGMLTELCEDIEEAFEIVKGK